MRKMEIREALECLVEQCNIMLYMIVRFAAGQAYNNFAIKMSLENVRSYVEELHDAIN